MSINELFPVGSVVLLKDAEKELMIIGILQVNESEKYDYMAVLYPEGYINQEYVYLFNHEDVAELKYIGYMSSEYQIFRSQLISAVESETME